MKDKSFDKLLQEKLQGHEYASSGPDWGRMESALSQADKDVKVDSEIRNRLKEHRVPYEPSHWELLKKKLELEKNLKRRIITSKVAEVVILVLLIFSAYQIKEYKGDSAPTAKADTTTPTLAVKSDLTQTNHIDVTESEALTNQALSKISTTEALTGVSTSQVLTDVSTSEAITDVSTSEALSIEDSQTIVSSKVQAMSAPTSVAVADQPFTANQQNGISDNAAVRSFENSTIEQLAIGLPEASSMQYQNEINTFESTIIESDATKYKGIFPLELKEVIPTGDNRKTNSTRPTALIQVEQANTQELRPLQEVESIASTNALASLDVNETIVPLHVLTIFGKAKSEHWAGLVSGVDINFLKTPNLSSFKRSTKELFELSYSTGIHYGFKKGANEILLGASFSSKTFDPGLVDALEVVIVTPDGEEQVSLFDRFHTLEKYDIVSLPFQYRRHINHESKFHPYVFGGLTTNVVLFATYEVQDQFSPTDASNSRPRPSDYHRDQVAQVQPEDYKEGFIQGGNYKDNIFLTGVVGAGMERKFNRLKVFVESQYTRNLFASRLGPRNVQLRAVSINMGAKYRI